MFGNKKTLKQKARENKRIINRSIRELDRELNRSKREQKKAQNEAKRLAKQAQNAAVKHLCKDIVRMKKAVEKFIKLKALLRQLSAKMDVDYLLDQTILKNVNNCYQSVSNQIKLPELFKMIQDNLTNNSEKMEMKQDMINDALDDALDADSDEEDQMVQQVMDEIGLDMNQSLSACAPMSKSYEAEEQESCDQNMSRRLAALGSASYSAYTPSVASYSRTKCMSSQLSYATRSPTRSMSRTVHANNTIGLSVGGAKDINNFRECIEKNIMPSVGSITYNGILYEYYFDTTTRKHVEHNIHNVDEKKDDGSKLFYPSYCYAKCRKFSFLEDNYNKTSNECEYYMTVGLNSNIKTSEFKRKHLNLVIVLDKSGSMSSKWDNKTKMQIANESVVGLLKHLTPKDRFGLVTFESKAVTMQPLKFINDINMDSLKTTILSIRHTGGTNFECGFNEAIHLYQQLFMNDDYKLNSMDSNYDHRIIFLTDARPNSGRTDEKSLFGMVQKYAENKAPANIQSDTEQLQYIRNRIYTTFIGIGVDFNAKLVESISQTRGCNYYSVNDTQDFMDKMDEEFEFMVTPLVFNVCLQLNCEGNQLQIDKVYGSNNAKTQEIIKSGEISRIHTLFPSKKRPRKKGGGTKGGIQLIKLKKANDENDDNNNMNVELIVTFEDRNGKKYKNEQIVTFKVPALVKEDMIENDDDDEKNEIYGFYDNTGIRKGILVCKYTELMMEWIKNTKGKTLKVNDKYKKLFRQFMVHFESEMVQCKDDDLKKEVDLMKKLVNISTNTTTVSSTATTNNNINDEDDLAKRLAMLK